MFGSCGLFPDHDPVETSCLGLKPFQKLSDNVAQHPSICNKVRGESPILSGKNMCFQIQYVLCSFLPGEMMQKLTNIKWG